MSSTVAIPDLTEAIREIEEAQPTPYAGLRMADRCDLCGAQAFVRTVHPANVAHDGKLQDLLWCGHHFKKIGSSLKDWTVLDETHRINGEPAA